MEYQVNFLAICARPPATRGTPAHRGGAPGGACAICRRGSLRARCGYAAVSIFDVPATPSKFMCTGCPRALPSALAARAMRALLTRAR